MYRYKKYELGLDYLMDYLVYGIYLKFTFDWATVV